MPRARRPLFRLSEDADVDLTWINAARDASESYITSIKRGGGKKSLFEDRDNQFHKKNNNPCLVLCLVLVAIELSF